MGCSGKAFSSVSYEPQLQQGARIRKVNSAFRDRPEARVACVEELRGELRFLTHPGACSFSWWSLSSQHHAGVLVKLLQDGWQSSLNRLVCDIWSKLNSRAAKMD